MAEKDKKKPANFTTPILVVLLVGTSFLVGTMWSRIRRLEGEGTATPTVKKENQAVKTSPVPEQPAVLGEKEIRQLEEGAAVKGEPRAPITIVEFSEYQCPYCERYVTETYEKLWKEYAGKIRYIFHDYPLPFHRHAQKAAEAARCAGDQGKYWEMHDLLFQKREWVDKEEITADLATFAKQLGLDQKEFENCLSSGKYTQIVTADMELGKSLGVTGTPTFFINGQKLVGAQPFESFKTIIEAELKK